MMKKLFVFFFAALAFCACNREECIDSFNESKLIKIGPVASAMTKSAIDGTTFPDDRTIVMSAYNNSSEGSSANYFSNVSFVKDGSTWTSGHYWPIAGTLDLFGYSIDGLTPTSTTYDTKVSEGVTLVLPDNSSAQTDIFFGSAQKQLYSASGTAIAFRHAQALVTFNAKCNMAYDATDNLGITITRITLNGAYHSGTVAIKATPTEGSYCTWSSLADSKDIDIPGISSYNLTGTMSSLPMGIGETGLMVPEQPQTSFTIYYTMHNGKDGSGNNVDNNLQYTYICVGDWKEGIKYNYEIIFNLNQITVNPSLVAWGEEKVNSCIPDVVSANYAVSGVTSVTLPTATMASNTEVMVDWGDGAKEAFTNATKAAAIAGDEVVISHTYSSAYTGSVALNVRSGSLDFGELATAKYEKFTVYDDTKVIVSENLLLSGTFTVNSSGKTVKFAKGNLYYDGSTSTWGFESNQYDYRTYAGANSCIGGTVSTTGTPADNWGLFGWVGASSTTLTGDLTKYGMSTSKTDSDYGKTKNDALKADWADIPTLPQVSGRNWKTLTGGSSGEWYYLLSTRVVNGGTGEGKSYQRATINSDATGVYGLIIYPDDYTSQTSATSYTSSEWSTMQNAGCVFLPAAGKRDGSSVYFDVSIGYYWSSTPESWDMNDAYFLYFHSGNVFPATDTYRMYGLSVRLVSAAQ